MLPGKEFESKLVYKPNIFVKFTLILGQTKKHKRKSKFQNNLQQGNCSAYMKILIIDQIKVILGKDPSY